MVTQTLCGWWLVISHFEHFFTLKLFPFFSALSFQLFHIESFYLCVSVSARFFPSTSTFLSPIMSSSAHVRPPRPPDAPPSVYALLAVSATLSGLAGEQKQPAGGGPGLPVCVATLLRHWHRHQVFCYGVLIYHSERTMRRRSERGGGCPL